MNTIAELEQRRRELLQEMESIRAMRRGTVAEQFLKGQVKGKKEPVERGPYFVFVRKVDGKSQSQRLRSPEEVQRTRQEVCNYRRFEQLVKEFAELTERLGELDSEQSASEEALKKGLKSRSNKAKK